MRRRTIEELRMAGAKRQRRWREKNRRTHRERVQELYGRSKAQGYFVGRVTPQEVVRYALAVEAGEVDGFVTDNASSRVETHMGPEGGWDVKEEEGGGRHGGIKSMGQADERGVGGADGGGAETANEKATYARLEELKARKGRGGLNAGVEVELEV